MKTTELIRLNIGVENQIDSSGDLKPVPGKDSTLFSIYRHQTGYTLFFRHDIPSSIRRQIETLDPETALQNHQTVCQILNQCIPCDSAFAGKGCYFAHSPSRKEFPNAVFHNSCYVILIDGEPVSWAWTADEYEQAAELAVETASQYRQRGYGRQVAAAWANHILGEGKVAFYSYEVGNSASEALARSLGVVQYAVVTTYESKSTVI